MTFFTRRGAPSTEGDDEERPPPAADDRGLLAAAPAEARFAASRVPRRRFWHWLFNGRRPEPLQSVREPVEPPEKGKLGICCSGGGIRSAAFSLGALQALQERDELRRSSYLAAVSGGSYIATAISILQKTGLGGSNPLALERMAPFARNSPEEQYLRNRTGYLAPTLLDKIYLGWRVVLGLLLNLTLVAIPLAGIALLLSGLVYAPSLHELAGACSDHGGSCAVRPPLWFWLATLGALGGSVVFGVATLLPRWRNEGWERFFTTWTTRLLLLAAALGLLLFAVPFAAELIRERHNLFGTNGKGTGLGVGTLVLLGGAVTQIVNFLTADPTQAELKELKAPRRLLSKLGSGTRDAIAYLAAGLVGPLFLFGVVAVTVALAMPEADTSGNVDPGLVEVGVAVLVGFALLYAFFDITNWSLHPYYKRRLSTVFALKRVRVNELKQKERDRVEAIGPAEANTDVGIAVERDYDEPVLLSSTALRGGKGSEWPTLLVCAAANVSDENATPPGRKVTSFTFSANSVGGPLVGAVQTWRLETAFAKREEVFPDVPPAEEETPEARHRARLQKAIQRLRDARARRRRQRDLSLPAAMAMSGAAISPSMGKMTKRPLTLLMALANVRLGVWVPNPRWVGELDDKRGLRRRYVRPRPFYLLCELFGLNRLDSKYLYVTDGGHYENLGLVELLRRGCTEIYCLDASGVGAGGVEFESLGEAITLARSELGVEIEFDRDGSPAELVPDKATHFSKRDVVTATIRYAANRHGEPGPTGKLVYVRNAMTETAPWDVRAHHDADPRFPNNPTIDQFYTDQKFEAYRVLGSRAAGRAFEAM